MNMLKPVCALLLLVASAACTGPENVGSSRQALVVLEPTVAADGTILMANAKDYAPLGYEEEDYVGRDIHDFHMSQTTIETMLAILLGGGELVNYPARLRRANGSAAYVLIRSSLAADYGHTRCFTSEVSQTLYTVRMLEMGLWEP